VGLTGMICCVAPAVLFMLGLAGGVWAISFADFFYKGTNGVGAWVLRGFAALIGIGGIILFKRKQDQCSVDPKRKRKNLILLSVLIVTLGVGFFLTLDKFTGWYFKNYIDPAKQAEQADQQTVALD
ncbi:MAG: hypothetical protein V3T53_12710, partial [Phycisphaerales bacterium]